MVLQNHIIKKFLVELGSPRYNQSYELQRRCATTIKQKVIAAMDDVLTHNFPHHQTVRINRIEIDLGNVPADKLETVFSEKLMLAFSEEIRKIAVQDTTAAVTAELPDENIILIEHFFSFLRKGVLAWSFSTASIADIESKVLTAIEKQPHFFAAELYAALQKNPVVAERLLLQFNSRFIITAVEAALPFLKSELQQAAGVVHSNAHAAAAEEIMLAVLQKILVTIFKISFTKTAVAASENEIYAPQHATNRNNESEKIKKAIADLFVKVQQHTGAVTAAVPPQTAKPAIENRQSTVEHEQAAIANEAAVNADESTFIQNAGLVLLHPFFKNLFTATGLMVNEQFTNTDLLNKAVHLLQYLANGQKEMPEYFLSLNKILCGVPQEMHINRFVKLSEDETAECTQLLQSVIQHWDVLKNSSPQALQETFLQRPGKLLFSKDENAWVLYIEKRGVDILLEKIPWGFSYIKHPWMEYAIRVDWQI